MRQILEGICWLMRNGNRFGIKVVNISVGAREGLNEEKENWLVEAVERLWDAGNSSGGVRGKLRAGARNHRHTRQQPESDHRGGIQVLKR